MRASATRARQAAWIRVAAPATVISLPWSAASTDSPNPPPAARRRWKRSNEVERCTRCGRRPKRAVTSAIA
eukprot:scaffold176193_cov35-Tisochrysis_lutea.AAC.2